MDLNHFIKESMIERFINSNFEKYLNTGLITQQYSSPLNKSYSNTLFKYEKEEIKYYISNVGKYIRRYLKPTVIL